MKGQRGRVVIREGRYSKNPMVDHNGIWNNEQDMEKQRINRENQEKNIRDDDTTDFMTSIRQCR